MRDHRGAAAVLGQAMITAHSRADLARLAVVAEWGDRLDGPVSPVVTLLRRNVAAMRAEVGGDPEAALAEFAQAPVHEVPRALALSVWRFHFHCLNMCGRGRERRNWPTGRWPRPETSLSGSPVPWRAGSTVTRPT